MDERVEYWYDTHEFLIRGVDFKQFPSPLCGCYVKEMPIQPCCRSVLLAYTGMPLLLMTHTTPEVSQLYSPKVTSLM